MERGVKRFLTAVCLRGVGVRAQAQVVCLPIDVVRVDNADILEPVNVKAIVAPYEGRCLGLVAFDEILEKLTLAYVDLGFVLSRAYLPEQDLTKRELIIKVVEGELSDITINGAQRPYWSHAVFPKLIGKPVNIRDVEQGLDQIESMPRWRANMEFTPGEDAGDSVLAVSAETAKPYQIKVTTDNRGNDQTGKWNTGLSGDFTNLLGINDTLTWGVSKSVGPDPFSLGYSGDQNNSSSFEYTLPYGAWTWSYGMSWSDYELTIPGAISPIVTNGKSRNQTLTARYLWSRDQTTKHTVHATLTRARNANYIQDVFIDASSRTLTGLELGYAVSKPFGPGSLDATFHVARGLTWFGAQDARDVPEGGPNPQYLLLGFSADYVQKLNDKTKWTSTATGQLSADRLYGGQSFAIGGVSTVRGSKIALASGSSGIVWRNEIDYSLAQTTIGSATLYGALDFGRILAQPRLEITSASALGSAIGIKLNNDNFNFDLSYQKILKVSEGLQSPVGEWFVNVEFVF